MIEFDERRYEQRKGQQKVNGGATTIAKPFPFTLAKDIKLEPKEFLIDGFLGRHEVSAWYGPPDSAKSVILVHAQACVAAGFDFCGRRVMQGPCLSVAAERGAITRRRVLAWCREHNLPDIPLAVIDHAIDLRTGKVDTDRIIATATELGKLCMQPVAWINFDTLNRILAGGDENSSKDMGAVMSAIDRIHRETKAHVSVVHHVPVDRSDRMRGHGLTLGSVDQANRVTKDTVVRLEVDKANDLVDKPAFAFEIKSVTIHINPETNIETTAPVLLPVDLPSRPAPSRRLSDRQRLAIAALDECAANVGQTAPTSLLLPASTIVVPANAWRDELYRRGVIEKDAANPRKDFQRVREQLHARQIIGVLNELVWKV
jgi:AAA domain